MSKMRTHIILPDWLSPGQFEAALRIFRDAADEDYVVARLAYKKMLGRQFLWSSNQAVEKYLKAASLCNGMDARFGHDWIDRYRKLTDLASQRNYQQIPVLKPPAVALSALSDTGSG